MTDFQSVVFLRKKRTGSPFYKFAASLNLNPDNTRFHNGHFMAFEQNRDLSLSAFTVAERRYVIASDFSLRSSAGFEESRGATTCEKATCRRSATHLTQSATAPEYRIKFRASAACPICANFLTDKSGSNFGTNAYRPKPPSTNVAVCLDSRDNRPRFTAPCIDGVLVGIFSLNTIQ